MSDTYLPCNKEAATVIHIDWKQPALVELDLLHRLLCCNSTGDTLGGSVAGVRKPHFVDARSRAAQSSCPRAFLAGHAGGIEDARRPKAMAAGDLSEELAGVRRVRVRRHSFQAAEQAEDHLHAQFRRSARGSLHIECRAAPRLPGGKRPIVDWTA
jgi:hypothetical protein